MKIVKTVNINGRDVDIDIDITKHEVPEEIREEIQGDILKTAGIRLFGENGNIEIALEFEEAVHKYSLPELVALHMRQLLPETHADADDREKAMAAETLKALDDSAKMLRDWMST